MFLRAENENSRMYCWLNIFKPLYSKGGYRGHERGNFNKIIKCVYFYIFNAHNHTHTHTMVSMQIVTVRCLWT